MVVELPERSQLPGEWAWVIRCSVAGSATVHPTTFHPTTVHPTTFHPTTFHPNHVSPKPRFTQTMFHPNHISPNPRFTQTTSTRQFHPKFVFDILTFFSLRIFLFFPFFLYFSLLSPNLYANVL